MSFIGHSKAATRPDERAQKAEEQARLQLAMELIDPDDKELLIMRDWDSMPFQDIAKELNIEEKAANKRYHRAVLRVGKMTRSLRTGELEDLVAEVAPFTGST